MTNRERVIASISHQQPDKVPYEIGFTQKAYQKMAEFLGNENVYAKLKIDNCMCGLGTELGGRWINPNVYEDEFGVQWDKSIDKDIGNPCNLVVTAENLNDCRFPNPDDPERYKNYEQVIRENPDRFLMPGIGFSLFERAWTMAGMENVLMGMAGNPRFVHALLDRITEFNLKVIEHACSYDVDGMSFGDDWGQQRGMLMGPRLWREFLKPRLRQMYAAVRARGKRVLIHCCGKVDEIFPDLIEIGLDVFNPFQPEVMDVYEMKRQYGDRLTFFGGISTQRTLPYGTVQETKDEVRRLIDKIGRNGGYIAAPAHAIPGDAKPENIAAMIEVLNGQ